MKRVLRQRTWQGEKADARAVGENLRNVGSAIERVPPSRVALFSDIVYPTDGLVMAWPTQPIGGSVIAVQKVDGFTPSGVDSTPEFKPTGQGTYAVKIGGLTVGERYATIRIVVYG